MGMVPGQQMPIPVQFVQQQQMIMQQQAMMNPQMQQAQYRQKGAMGMNLNQVPQQNAQPVQHHPSFSLYVGNLPSSVYDLDLFQFFRKQGFFPKSAKVMFDNTTRQSLNFGYVNFANQEDADKCAAELNNVQFQNKQLVVSRKKDKDFNSKANVIARNLPKELNQQDLHSTFSEFGKIISCKLEVYQTGESRGFGYIQYEQEEQADKAIAAMNSKDLHGKKIEVGKHSKKDERGETEGKYTNLYVQNLPASYTKADFENLFKEFGDINSIQLNEKSAGTGFISFKSHLSAKAAIEGIHMKKHLDGQAVLVNPHISRKENDVHHGEKFNQPITRLQKAAFKSNIFVSFVPREVSMEDLKKVFSEAGNIASIREKEPRPFPDGSKPNHSNYYVLYDDVPSAQKCIQLFDQSNPFQRGTKNLRVDFWQPVQDRQQE